MIPNPISNIIRSRLIACVSSLHPGKRGGCLDLPTAIDVIRLSRSGALVYHIPSDCTDPRDLVDYSWTFLDLLHSLDNIVSYDILANTSRSANAAEAITTARISVEFFYIIRDLCSHQLQPIIKLEVLDSTLKSVDLEVINATRELVNNDKLIVIPLISPNIKTLVSCADIGVPMVRILSGEIESLCGLQREEELKELISQSPIPIILEGGFGTIEHVRRAFNIGAAAVLLNSAFRFSNNPSALALELRKFIDFISFDTYTEEANGEQGVDDRRAHPGYYNPSHRCRTI
jgi:thiazole synthase ThiGH ThiG subunit